MPRLGLIYIFAIIACQLASGNVVPKPGSSTSPGFSTEQLNQLSGICFTAMKLRQNQSSEQQIPNPQEAIRQEEEVTSPKKEIPSGFEQIGSRFFYISKFGRMNWFAAGNTCREIGGQLATIQSEEELTALRRHLKFESYWIDMNDLVANGKYVSWNTGKAATYYKWHPNQSEEKINDQHCVDIFQGEMYYDNCFTKNLFICQAFEVY